MKLTKTMKEVIKYRDALHKGKLKVTDKNSSAVVYVGKNGRGNPTGVFFSGRRKKPNQAYYYSNHDQLKIAIDRFFKSQAKREQPKAKNNARELNVGDVLYTSWGYEQTNIDFYQVTKLIGKTMVEVFEIAKEKGYDKQDSGTCTPMVGRFVGEPMRKKASGTSISINSCKTADLLKPKATTSDGLKIYGSLSWSSWH